MSATIQWPEQSQADNGTKTLGTVDADCPTCHANCATAMHVSPLMPVLYSSTGAYGGEKALLSSAPPTLPERPNWADLA